MSDAADFDALTADLFEAGFRELDTEQAVHLYGAVLQVTAQLGAWEVEDDMAANDPEYVAARATSKEEWQRRMAGGYADTVRVADHLGEVARRYAERLSAWVRSNDIGPLYLYTVLACCGTVECLVIGDAGPMRFFDPERDELPTRGGLQGPGN